MGILYKFLETIVTGALAGIAAGGVITWISSIRNKKHDSLQRKEQTDYISNLVVKYRNIILERKLSEDIPVYPMPETVEVTLHRFYLAFQRELESALSGRAKRLAFDEIEEIKKLFRIGPYQLIPNRGLSEYEYIEMFRKAESIEWLKIPPMTRNDGG